MKERPILFSGAMVRAILEGRKTQTRRVIRPQPEQRADGWHVATKPRSGYGSEKAMRDFLPIYCSYGQPGDRLWVRETWSLHDDDKAAYKASATENELTFYRWHPSIHMPRAYSRITLEITGVRVERVQEISEADAVAEGVPQYTFAKGAIADEPPDPRWKFIELWDSINAKRGYSWASNPWVWVVEFKKV